MTATAKAGAHRRARPGRGPRAPAALAPQALPADAEALRRALRYDERRVTTQIAKDLEQHLNQLAAARDRCPHCRDGRAWEVVRLVWQRLLP